MRLIAIAAMLAATIAGPAMAQGTPEAVIADPPRDLQYPARMHVIQIPTGGTTINGIVYVASGPGPHPTFVFFHGLPGNERNLDLAQAVRRAGWNAVAVNYRGSWGSGGTFRFANTLEDASATLAYLRDPANAAKLDVDTRHIAIGGHSMGGWVVAETLAQDPALLGGVMISPADLGGMGAQAKTDRATVVGMMNDSRESLVDATGDTMTDELIAHAQVWSLPALAPRFAGRRALVLYSDDFVKPHALALIAATAKVRGAKLESAHTATDHSWSEARIALQSQVVAWLGTLTAPKILMPPPKLP